jgi:hypothetical protein
MKAIIWLPSALAARGQGIGRPAGPGLAAVKDLTAGPERVAVRLYRPVTASRPHTISPAAAEAGERLFADITQLLATPIR